MAPSGASPGSSPGGRLDGILSVTCGIDKQLIICSRCKPSRLRGNTQPNGLKIDRIGTFVSNEDSPVEIIAYDKFTKRLAYVGGESGGWRPAPFFGDRAL